MGTEAERSDHASSKEGLAKALGAAAVIAVMPTIARIAAEAAEAIDRQYMDLVLSHELEVLAGKEFREECKKDPDCWSTWISIWETEEKLNRAIEMEKRRRKQEALNELTEKLRQLGVGFDCDYDTCYIYYKGFWWNIRELPPELWMDMEGGEGR